MMDTQKKNPWELPYRILTPLLPFTILFGIFAVIVVSIPDPVPPPVDEETLALTPTATSSAFAGVRLDAKAAYVYDLKEKKILFSENAEAQLPLASLTKIMTAIVAKENLPDYTTVSVDPGVRQQGSASLVPGEKWKLKDLLDFTLVMSSNEGASSIAGAAGAVMLGLGQDATGTVAASAKKAFVEKMNEKAKTVGLHQTYFLNETGLDTTGTMSGAYGSARDMATLIAWALEHNADLFEATRYPTLKLTSQTGKSHIAINTDPLAANIPGLLISKTGLTDLAGGNLAVAFDASFGHPIIIVVLGSTEKGRFDDVKKLVDATIDSF